MLRYSPAPRRRALRVAVRARFGAESVRRLILPSSWAVLAIAAGAIGVLARPGRPPPRAVLLLRSYGMNFSWRGPDFVMERRLVRGAS
jgi:hypothetical protein